jgi:hypothetical protein
MNWIKHRFDQLILAVIAVALFAFAGMVLTKTGSFDDRLTGAVEQVAIPEPPEKGPSPVPSDNPLGSSPVWGVGAINNPDGSERGSLFVSVPYIVNTKGELEKADGRGSLRTDSITGKSIPDQWFIDHKLPYLQGSVALQDPDKDGFTNEDEWRWGTDPNDRNSHPPYHSKLFLKQVIHTPFRVTFAAWDGDLKKPETLQFQINTVDLKQPTTFVKVGELIPNTKFKVDRFESKHRKNVKIDEMEEVSELTVIDTESSEASVLVLRQEKNLPDRYAVFDYQWPPAAGDIRVKRFQQFALKPETDKNRLYKLVDIRESEAVIQTPDQGDYTVVRDTRKTAK